MTTKTSDPIDRRSLLRQIAIRIKWWGELDADEIIQMIKQAPKVGSEDEKANALVSFYRDRRP